MYIQCFIGPWVRDMTSAAKAKALKKAGRRDSVVNLRMSAKVRDLIDDAAGVLGKTRTDFIVDSSRKYAIDWLGMAYS